MTLKVWNGSSMVDGAPKVWNGSAFVDPVSAWIWDGSAFQQVWAPAASGAHYTDNFNRSNNASLGANWTSYDPAGLGVQLGISSNRAAFPASLPAGFGLSVAAFNTALESNNFKVSVTVGPVLPNSISFQVRSNGGIDYVSGACTNGDLWTISYDIGDSAPYVGDGATPAADSGSAASFASGDVLSFEASGNAYALKKNGGTTASWNDSGGDFSPYVDASHRKVAVAVFTTTPSASIDDFDTQDL